MAAQHPQRKRPRRAAAVAHDATTNDDGWEVLSSLFERVRDAKFLVFSGSGISVSAGLATFSSKHGLYAQAAKRYKMKRGSDVFCYNFLQSHPEESFAFFKHLYKKFVKAKPTPTHMALKTMQDTGQLVRHYTLNIDGLAAASGMSLWSPEATDNKTVELHGNLNTLVCRDCGKVFDTEQNLNNKADVPNCPNCGDGALLRFRVLMYDDAQSHLIHPFNPLQELLPVDLLLCDAVLWIGISFEQSASCEHFRFVLNAIQEAPAPSDKRRQTQVPMFLVDPNAADTIQNLSDGLQLQLRGSSGVFTVQSESDEFFKKIAIQQRKFD